MLYVLYSLLDMNIIWMHVVISGIIGLAQNYNVLFMKTGHIFEIYNVPQMFLLQEISKPEH